MEKVMKKKKRGVEEDVNEKGKAVSSKIWKGG